MATAFNHLWLIAPNEECHLGVVDQQSPVQIELGESGQFKVTVLPPIDDGEAVAGALDRIRIAAERYSS